MESTNKGNDDDDDDFVSRSNVMMHEFSKVICGFPEIIVVVVQLSSRDATSHQKAA
jgi:hypothetical protein